MRSQSLIQGKDAPRVAWPAMAPGGESEATTPWWRDAVIYQIYARSFQDSDGDGIGDLRGIVHRLDHLVDLGVRALWISPIYPSPLADFGYDVSDFRAIDPVFGGEEDFAALVREAHARDLKVLMDLVPCHTSIEHPWFREHPDWYVWADGGPPNNWMAAFGGSAWSRDERTGRWYLHSFYPEQPDLDWRNPEVVEAMQDVVRFWLDRGVDGFRIDAIEHLMKDPELRDDPPGGEVPFGLPLREEQARLGLIHSRDAPDIGRALGALRDVAPEALLVGEVYLPSRRVGRYLEHLDAAFAFEFFHSPWEASRLREAIEAAVELEGPAWVLSNHDFPRVVTRFGSRNARVAAMLLLTLPGPAFVYQGEEIGMRDGPGAARPYDRAGRDVHRHPMQWDGSAGGGFSTAEPWLPSIDSADRNVADQRRDPGSILNLYRELIALRPQYGPGFKTIDADEGVVAYERGAFVVAVNTTSQRRSAPPAGDPILETHIGAGRPGALPPHGGVVMRPG